MNNKTFLFLDIDGVLNRFTSNNDLDNDLLENLKILLNNLELDIVITSDRRYDGDEFKNLWMNAGLKMFVDMTEMNENSLTGDYTKLADIRTFEIQKYIDENKITNYIILDDLDLSFQENFYKTNYNYGLTIKMVEKIINHKKIV